METLRVVSAQFETVDGDIEFNMQQAEKMIRKVSAETGVDLMLFSEMCLDNFGDATALTRDYTDSEMKAVQDFWRSMAIEAGFALLPGFIERDDAGNLHNSCALFTPDGEVLGKYSKSHLYFEERDYCDPGDDPVVLDYKGWRIAPIICADLGFPEWIRLQTAQSVDLFCVPSCWAYPHDELWILCNRMRAAENTAYLVSCNRYGEEPSGRMNLGHSMAVNPKGDIIANLGTAKEAYFIADLDKSLIREERISCQWINWVRPDLYRSLL